MHCARGKKVVLVTGHYLLSKRRAGFHWLARSYHRAGWEVMFFTGAISRLSRLRRDHRLRYGLLHQANRAVHVEKGLWSYVWYTPFHAATVRWPWLERATSGWFSRYGDLPVGAAEEFVRQADLVIFESTPAIMLFDQVRRLAPRPAGLPCVG